MKKSVEICALMFTLMFTAHVGAQEVISEEVFYPKCESLYFSDYPGMKPGEHACKTPEDNCQDWQVKVVDTYYRIAPNKPDAAFKATVTINGVEYPFSYNVGARRYMAGREAQILSSGTLNGYETFDLYYGRYSDHNRYFFITFIRDEHASVTRMWKQAVLICKEPYTN